MHYLSKINRRRLILWAGLCSYLVWPQLSNADNLTNTNPYSIANNAPRVTVTVPSGSVVVDRDLEVKFAFAYDSAHDSTGTDANRPTSMTLQQITVCPPPEVRLIWPGSTCDMIVVNEELKVDAGQEVSRRKVLNPAEEANFTSTYEKLMYWFHFVTFEPGTYNFAARVKYVPGAIEEPLFQDIQFSVDMKPPLFVIVLGACLGAAMLSLFLFSMALWNSDKITVRSFFQYIIRSFAVFLIGAITAAIFVLLTFRLKSDTLPLSVTVNDFYGGIVIGLFTFKIASWLYAQLGDLKKRIAA